MIDTDTDRMVATNSQNKKGRNKKQPYIAITTITTKMSGMEWSNEYNNMILIIIVTYSKQKLFYTPIDLFYYLRYGCGW